MNSGGWKVLVNGKQQAIVCRPLETMLVSVEAGARTSSSDVKVRVLDGNRGEYFNGKIALDGKSGSLMFLAGGAQGRQVVEVTTSDSTVEVEFQLEAETSIVTRSENIKAIFKCTADTMQGRSTIWLDGREIQTPSGHWFRDHVHILKGAKYWFRYINGLVDYYLDNRGDDGSIFDYIQPLKGVPGNKFWRMDCEADLEYIAVDAVHAIWQTTGDDEWMRDALPKVERGLEYIFNDAGRWSKEHGLIKRPFSIDTWDFEYLENGKVRVGGPGMNEEAVRKQLEAGTIKQVSENGYFIRARDHQTKYCIFHGDNSGLYKACNQLSQLYAHLGEKQKSVSWSEKAIDIRERTDAVCWNGKFYTHQVHIDPVSVPVDESKQLSLSNTYDMNRGLPTHEKATSIIQEYQRRRTSVGSFAEWFSIDPPFPDGVFNEGLFDENGKYVNGVYGGAYEYINGTFMPLVGGELARACFEHGFEEYGVDILMRFKQLVDKHNGKIYFMYRRDGSPWFLKTKPGAECGPYTWGTSAMLYALIEGLAGVEDTSCLYRDVKCSPRWSAAGEKDVLTTTKYAPSGAYFAYRYQFDEAARQITLTSTGSGQDVKFHVLLPTGMAAIDVTANAQTISFFTSKVRESLYVDFSTTIGVDTIVIRLAESTR